MSEGIIISTKVRQVGCSLGIIIPSIACNSLKLEKDTPIDIELHPNKIIIRKEGE